MSRHPVLDPAADPRIRPEQVLAAAVLRQAVADVRSSSWSVSREDRADAIAFLTSGGDGLEFWCSVAGLNRTEVEALVARALDGHWRRRWGRGIPQARPAADRPSGGRWHGRA